MGWGLTREGGTAEDLSTELQYTHVPILPYHTCARLNSMKYDSKTIICAGDLKAEKDACQGDSGTVQLYPK